MGGHPFAAAISMLLVPMAPPGAGPLDIVAVDTSALPRVAIEVVAPVRFSAEPLTAAAVDVDGAAVESVTALGPRDVIVGIVIDDRPAIPPAVVTASQGAAVQLVRNSRGGIEVSLGTPSGLRTALTSDRDANIARIAGITAGSPAVVPLTGVVSDTVDELAASEATDRHAVVLLGGAVDSAELDLARIADALNASGTVLHVVAPTAADAGALRRIAERSGGEVSTSPAILPAVDAVTAVISNRYRVVATVAGAGPHRIGLSLGGRRFSADFDVPSVAPRPSRPSSPPPQRGETPGSTPRSTPRAAAGTTPGSAPASVAAPTPATIVEQAASSQPLAIAQPPGGGRTTSILLAALAIAVVVLVAAGVVIAARRRTDGDDEEPYRIEKPGDAPKPLPRPVTKTVTVPGTDYEVDLSPDSGVLYVGHVDSPSLEVYDVATGRRLRAVGGSTRAARLVEPPPPPEPPAPTPAGEPAEWIATGDLRVSLALGEVWCGDRKVVLTQSELRVLELLIASGDRGVTREALVEASELDDAAPPDAVEAIVTRVRRKTGISGRGHAVRRERVVTYFLE